MNAEDIVNNLEEEYDIDILVMTEIGSRAYNLHSDDSDYDAYVLFRQDPSAYIGVNTYRENVHKSFDEDWDVQGWNIKRFGELVHKSNPTAIEFLSSTLNHYARNDHVKTAVYEFSEYAIRNANPIGLYYHYNSLAKENYSKYINEGWNINRGSIADSNFEKHLDTMAGDPRISEDKEGNTILSFGRAGNYPIEEAHEKGLVEPTTSDRSVKRNLFIVRGICCAKWVRHYKSVPPMDFETFLRQADFLADDTKDRIWDLVGEKRAGNNHTVGNPFEKFIESEFQYTLDDEKYNEDGLSTERVNSFIENLLDDT